MFNFVTLQSLFLFDLVLLVLVLALLFQVWRLTSHYNRLTQGVSSSTLMQVLEGIQKTLSQHEKKLLNQEKKLASLRQRLRQALQRVILRRFNPFSHTGGKQSFILAFLYEDDNGVMITSLHSRENTRFYVKSIKAGESEEHSLSPEEEKLIRRRRG